METEKSQRGGMTAEMGHEGRDCKKESRRQKGGGRRTRREGKESVGFEFFTYNVKLLITALEHQHGESGPADCDLGFKTLT